VVAIHSHNQGPPPDPPFCSSDRQVASLFVEVTPTTATPAAALGRLVADLARCLPPNYDVAFDAELDVTRARCVGAEWWTVDSRPAGGPGPGVRRLWRFDVRGALTLTRVAQVDVDEDPGVPDEALRVLADHWRAGRIGDADYERLLVLAEAQAAAIESYARRRDAAPATAPRVELRDDERYAVLVLMDQVIRLLAPLLGNEDARLLLASGLRVVEDETAAEESAASAALAADLAALPQAPERPPRSRRRRT
jgi:hypothetical protein